jgi:LPS sulfotransferase NodH
MRAAFDALRANRSVEAERLARSVIAMAPRSVDAWLVLGCSLDGQGRFDEAKEALARADAFGPGDARVTFARARVASRTGDFEQAIRYASAVRGNDGMMRDARVLQAASLRRLGRRAEALDVLREHRAVPALAVEWALVRLDEGDANAAIQELEPLVPRATNAAPGAGDFSPIVRYRVFHTLGEAYEAAGRYDDAFRSYQTANLSFGVSFREAAYSASVARVRETFSAEWMRTMPKPSVRTERPVFVAAMPRSGTTLLDRIVAAHPEGGGAGETMALHRQMMEWTGPNEGDRFPAVARRLTSADLDRVATRYLRDTEPFAAGAQRVVDKHLQNWACVGLIAMAFPDARVIHLRRDPLDNAISCFERLDPSAVAWAARLETIGLVMRESESLMAHWREHAPIRILTVDYETLVREPRAETQRILDFLGLPWNDACLEHHRRKPGAALPPPTLATDQAAKPITDRSIGRGARFGALLDPLRAALAAPR